MRTARLLAILILATITANGDDISLRARAKELSDLAWQHWREVQFERALSEFRQVLPLSRELHDRTLEGRTINFIGLLYQTMGDTSAAAARYQEALPIAREVGDRKLEGEVLYHLGWMNFQLGKLRDALPYYTDSLRARRETGDRYGEAMTLLGLGMTHTSLAEYEQALQCENEALRIAEDLHNAYAEADALDHIGTALTLMHRPAEAIPRHQRALDLRRSDGETIATSFSLSGLARAQHDAGQIREAASTMGELIDTVEGSRRNVITRRFRASVFAKMHGHYERTIDYLMQMGDAPAAFAVSERARARMTLDAVQDALVRADASAGGKLLDREESLQNSIEHAGSNLDELLAQLTAVEDEIRAQYPRLAAARDEHPLGAQEVQSGLDANTAVIEYAAAGEKIFAWRLTRQSVDAVELHHAAEIRNASKQLHELLAAGDQRMKRHDIDVLIERLSALVIAPLKLPPVSRLLIVPDGALFYVPFAALMHRGSPLIDQFEITIAPSASAAALMSKVAAGRRYESSVAIFADPVFTADDPRVPHNAHIAAKLDRELAGLRRLPSTRAEAEAISGIAGRATTALDFAASRQTLVSENLSRYRVVHFATHALVGSGIVLSLVDENGAPVNGFLRVHDLYNLNVGTDLVVLSACRTAMGKQLRGEGIVGMVNGFMHAGAPRVVASYWDVRDQATSELMRRFYRGMFSRHLTPAAALREAQRSMRSEERWKSPVYWAAFAVFGAG